MQRSALVLLLLTVAPALAAAEDPPATHSDAVELWVQPIGSVLYGGIFQAAYVSAGATVRLPQRWELALEGAFQWIPTGYSFYDNGAPAPVWQLWVSVGAVRFFPMGRPHDGFFAGPKLEGTFQHADGGDLPNGGNAGGLTITWEVGYRFQFGHFALSFILPSVGLGYGWNESVILTPNLPGAGVAGSGLLWSFDLNVLRVGVSF